MKHLFYTTCLLIAASLSGNAQALNSTEQKNHDFEGAAPTQKKYQAIYQLDNNDPKLIEKAIRNMNNALNDPRLQGKLLLELVAFSAGTDAYIKGGKYENDLRALVNKGVIVTQCGNTLRERKISRDSIYNFIGVVPSANGELILRQAEGWAIIKP